MTGFLIVVGLTGSWLELSRWLTPRIYPAPRLSAFPAQSFTVVGTLKFEL